MRATIKTSDVYSAEGNEHVYAMRCLLNTVHQPVKHGNIQ